MNVRTDMLTVEHRGCRLAYNVRGDGPPVLLIQGVGLHGDGWLPQVEEMASQYRCLTFDNRGMGRSQPLGTTLSIELMAEDARVLMDAQGWESAHIVGHSMGGLIALQLALAARARVRSLSLLCTFADGRIPTRLSPWMMWTGLRTRVGPRLARRRAFLEMVIPPKMLATADHDALAERLAPIFGHDLADQPPVVMKQLSATGACNLTPLLGQLVGLPTLVVSAEHDRIAPPSAGRQSRRESQGRGTWRSRTPPTASQSTRRNGLTPFWRNTLRWRKPNRAGIRLNYNHGGHTHSYGIAGSVRGGAGAVDDP